MIVIRDENKKSNIIDSNTNYLNGICFSRKETMTRKKKSSRHRHHHDRRRFVATLLLFFAPVIVRVDVVDVLFLQKHHNRYETNYQKECNRYGLLVHGLVLPTKTRLSFSIAMKRHKEYIQPRSQAHQEHSISLKQQQQIQQQYLSSHRQMMTHNTYQRKRIKMTSKVDATEDSDNQEKDSNDDTRTDDDESFVISTIPSTTTTDSTTLHTTNNNYANEVTKSVLLFDDETHRTTNKNKNKHITNVSFLVLTRRIRQYIQKQETIRRIMTVFFQINHVLNQSILLQVLIIISLYLYHLVVCTQNVVILFYNTVAIGYDSYIGCILFAIFILIQQQQQKQQQKPDQHTTATTSSTTTSSSSYPWTLPRPRQETSRIILRETKISDNNNNDSNSNTNESIGTTTTSTTTKPTIRTWLMHQPKNAIDFRWIRFRISMIVACTALIKAYYQTGRYSLFWEDLLYTMSARGWPLTIPLSRSIQVLAGHLTWVCAGTFILWLVPRPPPFFQQQEVVTITSNDDDNDDQNTNNKVNGNNSSTTTKSTKTTTKTYQWFRMSLRNCNWVWWTIGGYYVSSWLFNIADMLNRQILPLQVLQDATESVVSQLVQPEQNDILASIIGYIAPCISAPVWEELLYRGFLLAGLTTWTGSYHISCIVQAVIFSAHHMSITAALPLFVLGYTWAVLYTQSKNLWTVIAVHAMWNSRVFLGSWFGL